jgi:HEPN domain-containing protein
MSTQVKDARRLLDAADNDELIARSLLPIEGVADAGIGYHCQQAVEKAIKAVLTIRAVGYRFVHDLDYLRKVCEESGIAIPATLDGAEELTPFALAERYGAEGPISLDRDQALKWSAAAVAWARTVIDEAAKASQDQTADLEPDQPPQSSS